MKIIALLLAISLPLSVGAGETNHRVLPNLPSQPGRAIESDAEFFKQKRDEEAHFFAKGSKEPYEASLREAAAGSKKHLALILASAQHQDGAGAEGYADTVFWLMHKVGDEAFSSALLSQPKSIRARVIHLLDYGAHYDYSRAFPKTFRVSKHTPL
jgi:hypothetical protein